MFLFNHQFSPRQNIRLVLRLHHRIYLRSITCKHKLALEQRSLSIAFRTNHKFNKLRWWGLKLQIRSFIQSICTVLYSFQRSKTKLLFNLIGFVSVFCTPINLSLLLLLFKKLSSTLSIVLPSPPLLSSP